MTEQTAPENDQQDKPVSPEVLAKIQPFAPMFEVFKGISGAANARAAKIKSATSDKADAIDAVLSTSEDEKIVEWRKRDEEIRGKIKVAEENLAKMREAIKAHAATQVPGVDTSFDVEKEKKAFADDRAKATAIRKSLLLILGDDEEALKAGMEKFGIVEVVSFRGNSAGTSKGASGIRRPRITSATVSVNGADPVTVEDAKGKTSFTILTQYLSKNVGTVDGDIVRKAAFTAAGTEDLSTLDAGTEVPFTLTIGDKQVKVTVTAKGKTDDSSDATGEPAGSNDDSEDDAPPAE